MSVRINAVGDISFNGCYHELVVQSRQSAIFSEIGTKFDGDVVIGNLESPLTLRPEIPPAWRYRLRGHPNFARTLREAGFTALTLGNNHAMDFGAEGLFDTMRSLKMEGIPHTGAGRNLREARVPVRLLIKDQRISILSYCSVPVNAALYATETEPGVCPADPKMISEDVAKARHDSDVVVVCLHWGEEHKFLPSPQQRKLAAEVIHMGVDVILGHHSHVLQPAEMIGNKLVAYSLGNFVFSSEIWEGTNQKGERFTMEMRLQERHRLSGILNISLSTDGVQSFSLEPTMIEGNDPIRFDHRPRRKTDWETVVQDLTGPHYWVKWMSKAIQDNLWETRLRYFPNGIMEKIKRIRPRHARRIWGSTFRG